MLKFYYNSTLGVNLKKIFLVLIFINLFANSVFAVVSGTVEKHKMLNLNDCINTALKNSPIIKRSKLEYETNKNQTKIAKAQFFPRIGVSTGYNINSNSTNRTSYSNNTYTLETSLNQLIWDFGKTNANINMQKFNTIYALYNFNNVVLETIYGVKLNYYAVLAAKFEMDISEANVQVNERNYQKIKAFFEEGLRSKIDLVNAEVNLSDSKISLVQARNKFKNALIQLNNSMYDVNLLNYQLENVEIFDDEKDRFAPVDLSYNALDSYLDLDMTVLPSDVEDAFLLEQAKRISGIEDYKLEKFNETFEECIKYAYEKRPDLKAYDATLNAMKESLKYIRREYYPEIGAQAGYGFRDENSMNSFNVSINLTSNVNILAKKYEIDNAKIQVQLAQTEIELARDNIFFEIQNYYINMIELEKQVPLLAIKVKQTFENYKLADGRYSVGLGDFIELQDAITNYNNAQLSYIEAIYNYNIAKANLEKSIAKSYPGISFTIDDVKIEKYKDKKSGKI